MQNKLRAIFDSAIASVNPANAIMEHLKIKGNILQAGGFSYNLDNGKLYLLGAGKGAAPMAQALENVLGDYIRQGFVVVKYDHILPLTKIDLDEAAHPVPDKAGEAAAQKCLEIASQCGPEDLLLCFFTGGASALLPLPASGLTLEDIKETTRLLLAAGADIGEINAIRKHLSRISGGRLAQAARGQVLGLLVSDVIGDDLSVIASGPTYPDSSTFTDCKEILARFDLADKVPAAVREVIRKGLNGEIPETPKPDMKFFEHVHNLVIASNSQALRAAAKKAEELGFKADIIPTPISGDTRIAASQLISYAKKIAENLPEGAKPVCILAGGETTIQLKGCGLGGRNQEMALQASLELIDEPEICALFAGTDGTDGPTDAAGGFAFMDSVKKIGSLSEAKNFQANNDSYHALKKSGDLLITGPTLTNVMDIAIIIVKPEA